MACFVYVIFGTSRDINLGPTAVMSLLVAEFAHSIPELAALLALISGLIQFAMGLFHVGEKLLYMCSTDENDDFSNSIWIDY